MSRFVAFSPEYYAKIIDAYLYCILDQITNEPEKINYPLIYKFDSINESVTLINAAIIKSGLRK